MPFFEAMKRNVLSIQKCRRCAAMQLGELNCNQCFAAELEWIAASGRGTVHSFAVVHLPYHPAFAVPYGVASVELEEGPRLLACIVDCDLKDLKVGMRVWMRPSLLSSGVTVPVFAPA